MTRVAERRFLLTGGAGFIGSRLAALLAGAGHHDVVVFDNLHPQVHGPNPVPRLATGVTFVRGDVTNAVDVERVVREHRPHVVVHLAAETGTGQSHDEIARYCNVIVQGTAHLLESVRRHAPELERVVLPSSRAVYGEGAYRRDDGRISVPDARSTDRMLAGEYDPLDDDGSTLTAAPTAETCPVRPASIYASTKLMQEYLVKQAGDDADWDATILRLQNVYGPGQSLRNPYTGVLSIFSAQLIEGRTLSIYEDGEITRDFVFVDDVVRALERACHVGLPHGTTINVGSGRATTILDVAHVLCLLLRGGTHAFEITGEFRAGDVRHAVADVTRAATLLGWRPEITIEEGLEALTTWATEAAAA